MTWPWAAVIGWLITGALGFGWLAIEARRCELEHQERLREMADEIEGIVR
jgi:hypothetical protein